MTRSTTYERCVMLKAARQMIRVGLLAFAATSPAEWLNLSDEQRAEARRWAENMGAK